MDLLHTRKHFGFIGLGLIGGSVARCIRNEIPDAQISAYNYYETKKHPRLEKALADGVSAQTIITGGWVEKLIKIKYDIPNDKPEMFKEYLDEMSEWFSNAEVK